MSILEKKTQVDSRSSVNDWLEKRGEIIESMKSFSGRSAVHTMDPSRSPSELQVCTFMKTIELPVGFELIPIQKGIVRVFNDKGEYVNYHPHCYAQCGDDVLCLTFAHFFDEQFGLSLKDPGMRIAQYQKRAPDLVYPLGVGVAALFGDKGRIFAKTGLEYSVK